MTEALTALHGARIAHHIFLVRGRRVLVASDLARLYGVSTSNLNKAVKRNIERFPADFMFQLTPNEARALTFQIGMSKPRGRGGRRVPPYAFTEHGVAMLSSVLHSRRAIRVNIAIMRAFARIRAILESRQELAQKLSELERRINTHDSTIQHILSAIRSLIDPPAERNRERIGFRVRRESGITRPVQELAGSKARSPGRRKTA